MGKIPNLLMVATPRCGVLEGTEITGSRRCSGRRLGGTSSRKADSIRDLIHSFPFAQPPAQVHVARVPAAPFSATLGMTRREEPDYQTEIIQPDFALFLRFCL